MLMEHTLSVAPACVHAMYATSGVAAVGESRKAEVLHIFLEVVVFLVFVSKGPFKLD